jgi:(5-formylfuran-3-yl)methyl phosphate synthase
VIPTTPALLVSVRDAAEALDALAGGADWIDLKEPRRGALGAVDAATARSVVQAVANRVPVSAAIGELIDWPAGAAQELLNEPGISHLKLGLAGCGPMEWHQPWLAAQRQIAAAGKHLVAVIYADADAAGAPCADDILATAIAAQSPWVLWDTFDKAGPSLEAHVTPAALAAQLAKARAGNRRTVVAGRLDAGALDCLPLELIDVVAVRGVVCRGGREKAVCRDRVAAFRAALVTARSPEASAPSLNTSQAPRMTG